MPCLDHMWRLVAEIAVGKLGFINQTGTGTGPAWTCPAEGLVRIWGLAHCNISTDGVSGALPLDVSRFGVFCC